MATPVETVETVETRKLIPQQNSCLDRIYSPRSIATVIPDLHDLMIEYKRGVLRLRFPPDFIRLSNTKTSELTIAWQKDKKMRLNDGRQTEALIINVARTAEEELLGQIVRTRTSRTDIYSHYRPNDPNILATDLAKASRYSLDLDSSSLEPYSGQPLEIILPILPHISALFFTVKKILTLPAILEELEDLERYPPPLQPNGSRRRGIIDIFHAHYPHLSLWTRSLGVGSTWLEFHNSNDLNLPRRTLVPGSA